MRLDKFTNTQALGETQQCEIDETNIAGTFQMLINAYSDPIGSLVREVVSNGFDATIELMKENGQDINKYLVEHPVEVSLGKYFEVRDYGIGISPERATTLFRKLGASTKRESDDFIGGFGIGRFSPLSYTHSFDIITRYGGMEYVYKMILEDIPTLASIAEYPTTEPSGTTIRIEIKSADHQKFKAAIKMQLAYFDNVWYNISGLSNEYEIHHHKTFSCRRHIFNQPHIVLGNVFYPLREDFTRDLPAFGIRFNIGELKVTPNREQILYNEDVIATIKKRIDEFKLEINKLYREKMAINDFKTYLEGYYQTPSIHGIAVNGIVATNKTKFDAFPDSSKGLDPLMGWDVYVQGFSGNSHKWDVYGSKYSRRVPPIADLNHWKEGRFNKYITEQHKVKYCLVKTELTSLQTKALNNKPELKKHYAIVDDLIKKTFTKYDDLPFTANPRPKVAKTKITVHKSYGVEHHTPAELAAIPELIWVEFARKKDLTKANSIGVIGFAFSKENLIHVPKHAVHLDDAYKVFKAKVTDSADEFWKRKIQGWMKPSFRMFCEQEGWFSEFFDNVRYVNGNFKVEECSPEFIDKLKKLNTFVKTYPLVNSLDRIEQVERYLATFNLISKSFNNDTILPFKI